MKKGVVILHGGGLGEYCQSFDVLVRDEYLDEYRWVEDELYIVDCKYVERFLEKHKGWCYLGSGDFKGVCATDYIRVLARLMLDGFEFRCESELD